GAGWPLPRPRRTPCVPSSSCRLCLPSGRQREDFPPSPCPLADQPLTFHLRDGGAHGSPGRAEPLAQLLLGGEAVADLHPLAAQQVGHPLDQRPAVAGPCDEPPSTLH